MNISATIAIDSTSHIRIHRMAGFRQASCPIGSKWIEIESNRAKKCEERKMEADIHTFPTGATQIMSSKSDLERRCGIFWARICVSFAPMLRCAIGSQCTKPIMSGTGVNVDVLRDHIFHLVQVSSSPLISDSRRSLFCALVRLSAPTWICIFWGKKKKKKKKTVFTQVTSASDERYWKATEAHRRRRCAAIWAKIRLTFAFVLFVSLFGEKNTYQPHDVNFVCMIRSDRRISNAIAPRSEFPAHSSRYRRCDYRRWGTLPSGHGHPIKTTVTQSALLKLCSYDLRGTHKERRNNQFGHWCRSWLMTLNITFVYTQLVRASARSANALRYENIHNAKNNIIAL